MANNSTPDVFLLLGVEGGGDIGKGSGALIARQLKQIMHDVEETITSHLKISLDTDSLAELKSQIEKAIVDARAAIKSEPLEFEFSFDQKSIDKAFRDVKQQLKEQHITISAQPQEKKPKQGGSGDIGGASGSPSLENTKKEAEGVKQEIAGVEKAAEKVADAIESISEAERKAAEEAKKLQAIINKTIELDFPTGGLEREYKTTLGYLSDFISTRRTAKAKQDDYVVSTKDFTKFMNANHADDYGWWAYKYEDPAEQREKVKEWITREYDGYDDLFDFIKNKDDEITGIRIKNQEELQKRIQDQHEIQRKIYDDQEKYNEAIRTAREQLGLSPNDSGWGYDINADQLRQLEQSVPGIQEALQIKAHGDITKTLEEAEKASQELKKIQDTFQAVEETATPAFDSVEQGLEDVAAAEEKIQASIPTLPGETSTLHSQIQVIDEYSDFVDKMQSLNSDSADKAIDKITESIQDQAEAIQENTEALEENHKEQAKGGILREPTEYVSTSISEAANGKTVTTVSKGLNTGRIYSDTEKTIIDKNGDEQILNSYKIANTQINNMLESVNKKLIKLREKRDELLEMDTSNSFVEEINTEIDEAINKADSLREAIYKASVTGYYGDLEDKYGANNMKDAEADLQRYLRKADAGISKVRKNIAEQRQEQSRVTQEQERYIEKLDDTHFKIEACRAELTSLGKVDVTNVTEELQYGINKAINETELLELALRDAVTKGDFSLLSEFDIDNIDDGLRTLQDRIKGINSSIQSGVSTVSTTATTSERLLKQASEQVVKLRRELEKLDDEDTSNVAADAKENIRSGILYATQLIDALQKVSETGDYVDLYREERPDLPDDFPRFSTFTEGYEALRSIMVDTDDLLKQGRTDVANYNKEWDNLTQTQARAVTYFKEFNNINRSQYNTKGNSKYNDLNEDAKRLAALYEIVKNGEAAFEANSSKTLETAGVNSYTEAVHKLTEELGSAEAKLKEFKATASNISDQAALAKLNEYKEAITALNKAPGGFDSILAKSVIPENLSDEAAVLQHVKEHYDEISAAVTKTRNEVSRLNAKYSEEQNNLTQRHKIFQEAKNYYDKYQSGIKANIELNQRWLKLMQQVHDGEINNEEARRALAELQTATKDANAETMTLWGSLKKLFTDHFGSVSATAAIGVFRNILRGAYQNVLDIDKAMTELKKVTDLAESQYVSFQNRAADMAREVGGTIADTISSTADYARLGYSLLDSEALAKAALTYKNVGDGIESIDEATASIISTIKAYNIEAKDAMQVVDLYNLLGNSLPISSGALGTALQKSASALAAANNTLEESAALISAANSVVQNEEVTGTAMKTISMYLRAAKTEAEEAGIETDGMADSVAKLRQELLDLANVDIMLDDDTFKSTYQIIKELSEVWDEISDVSQANILEKIGGKRNANINAALIENFDIAEKALALSQNAAGSALKENEKYLESIEGHINKLTVAYEDLSQTVINSDLVKIGVDALTALTGGAADLIKQFGTLQTMIPIIAGGLSAFKNVGIFRVATDSIKGARVEFNLLGKSIENIRKDLNTKQGIFYSLFSSGLNEKDVTILQEFEKTLSNGSNRVQLYKNIMNNASVAGQDFAKSMVQLKVKLDSGAISQADYNRELSSLHKGMEEAGKAAASFKAALLNIGVSVGISLLVTLFQEISKAQSEAIEKAKQAAEEVEQEVQAILSLKQQYDDLLQRYRDDKSAKDQLTSTANELIKTLKIERSEVQGLADDYSILTSKINEKVIGKLKEESAVLLANFNNVSKFAEDTPFTFKASGTSRASLGVISTASLHDDAQLLTRELTNFLEDFSLMFKDTQAVGFTRRSGSFYADSSSITANISNIDNARESYEKLTKVVDYFQEKVDAATLSENTFFKSLVDMQTRIGEYISQYDTALDTYNENIAQQIILNNLIGQKIPETTKEFEEFKKSLIDSIYTINDSGEKTTQFIGITQEDYKLAENAIVNLLSTMPEFKEFFETTNSGSETTRISITSLDAKLQSLKETIDSVFANQSTLQSAFDKISAGSLLSAEDVRKLVEVFPELATQFNKVADGYTITSEALIKANNSIIKSTRQAIEEQIGAYQNAIDKFTELKTASGMPENVRNARLKNLGITEEQVKNARQQINSLNLILNMFGLTLEEAAESLDKYSDALTKCSSNMKTVSNAFKEQSESGSLSVDTILAIVENGYAAALMYDSETKALKLNADAYLELAKAELQEQSASLLASAWEQRNKQIELNAEVTRHSALMTAEAAQALINEAIAAGQTADELFRLYDANQLLIENLSDVTSGNYGSGNNSDSDQAKDAFDKYMSSWQRLYDRGLITADKYYQELNYANETYYANSLKHAEDYEENITKIYNHEKEAWKEKAEEEKEILEKQLSDGYITQQQYNEKLIDLANKYYGASPTLAAFNQKMQEEWGLGNVDLTSRPKYKMPDGSTATVYSGGEFLKQGTGEDSRYVYVTYTPIIDDTTMLSDEEIDKYLFDYLDGSSDLLEADAQGKRLILKVDTDLDLTPEDIAALDKFGWTDHLEEVVSHLDEWAIGLHEIQAEWLDVSEAAENSPYYGTEWAAKEYKALFDESHKLDQSLYKEDFQKQREDLDEELKKGFSTVEQFQNKLRELRDTWWGENSDWFGTTFASEMYDSLSKELADVGDLYDEYLDTLKKRNNGTIEAMEAFVDEWRRMNEGLYMRTDPKQYQANLAEIIDYEKSILDKKYDEGLISAKKYQQELLALWEDNSDILGKSTYGEWLTESLDKRASQEKTYWEQQKKLIEDYYDKQIEELQKVQDEQERVKKAEELRLNLIKARQALEDAKKQRNQLIFENGTFRYDVDQDAVLSAEESLADAIKAISENELQEQIKLLQEQKETETNIYDAIINMIDQYTSKSTLIKASDTDMLNLIRGSIYGEDWAKQYNGEVQANEVTDEQKAVINSSWSPLLSKIKGNAAAALEVAAALVGLLGTSGSNSGSVAQDAVSNAMQNTYNNSTITDDHSVNVGDVHVTVQGGTSKEMIDEFANKLSSAITQVVPRYAPA